MSDLPKRYTATILQHRSISSSGYELTLERNGMPFTAGRLLTLHGRDITEDRSYTIASGESDEVLQVLYRRIPSGKLTNFLATLKEGDVIDLSGPFGEFTLRDRAAPIVFVATGTGIAPCRSFLRTHPDLTLTVIHGARYEEDLFYRDEFAEGPYHPCLSREPHTECPARVTELLAGMDPPPETHFYLCGSNEMIFDAHRLLREKGVPDACIFTEEYYYRFDA